MFYGYVCDEADSKTVAPLHYWVLTKEQHDWCVAKYHRLCPTDAFQAERVKRQTRALVEAAWQKRDADEQKRVHYQGKTPTSDMLVDGWWDVKFGTWVPSEVQGKTVDGYERTVIRSPYWTISPYVLDDALCYLLGATVSPTSHMRGWMLNAAGACLAKVIWAAKDFRDTEVVHSQADADAGTVAWLKRDPEDMLDGRPNRAIVSRWCRPDDELEFMDRLRAEGREGEWTELLTDFRRTKLKALVYEYFDLEDDCPPEEAAAKKIVLKWRKAGDRWVPAEVLSIKDWVRVSEIHCGSLLGALQSCSTSLVRKLELKSKRSVAAVYDHPIPDQVDVYNG